MDNPTPPSDTGAVPAASPLAGLRAVIVEDEGITQLQLSRILRSAGLTVIGSAADGKEAVDLVLATLPDIVLMDIRMPVMNGLEAAERILAEKNICILMLSAFSEEEYLERARRIGASGYIIKPVTAESLLPQLEAVYRRHTSESGDGILTSLHGA